MLLMEPLRRRPRRDPPPSARPVGALRKAQRERRACIRAGKDLAREYRRVEAERNAALGVAQNWQTETGLQRQLYLDLTAQYDALWHQRERLQAEVENLQASLAEVEAEAEGYRVSWLALKEVLGDAP